MSREYTARAILAVALATGLFNSHASAQTPAGKIEITKAEGFLDIAQKLVPNSRALLTSRRSLLDTKEEIARLLDLQRERDKQVKKLLAAAQVDVNAGRLSAPLGNNALEKFSCGSGQNRKCKYSYQNRIKSNYLKIFTVNQTKDLFTSEEAYLINNSPCYSIG